MTVSQQQSDRAQRQAGAREAAGGLVRAARPKQWVKNVLVFAAPAAAGLLFDPAVAMRAGVAFVCFCLVASGTYLLNDALDVEADRRHPVKRHRPIAAGIVGVGTAKLVAVVVLALGVGLGVVAADWRLGVVLGIYVAVMQGYSLGLKRIAVIELALVSSGFVLRAIAGGVAADVELSTWFLLVTSFGSLFMVAGKRHAEVMTLGTGAVGHREALREYPEGFVLYVGAVSAAVAIMAYCLWSLLEPHSNRLWFELSIVPFVLAILRYALLSARGEAGAPEDVFTTDRTLQVLAALWLLTYGAGVYAG